MNATKRVALREHSLLDIFFFIFPESVFEQISEWTDVYAYLQPVKAVKVNNRDGNVSRKKRFIPCSKRNVGATTRAENENCKYEITVGFIIAWTGVIILHGAISDSSKSIRQYYIDVPYGISYPPIKNSMTRNAYEFMRRYFHPSNPTRLPKKRGESGYDALIKVRWIGKTIPVMKGLRNA